MKGLLLRKKRRGGWRGKGRVGEGSRNGKRGWERDGEGGEASIRLNRVANCLTPAPVYLYVV